MTTDIADIVGSIVANTQWNDQLFYITGTRLAANQEWTMAGSNLSNKLPLVWLLETINEKFYGTGSAIERESEVRIFFLNETNITEFYTEQHRQVVVQPMTQLAQNFVAAVNATTGFATIDDYQIRSFARFGVETQQGVVQNILDANLSGVELQVTLTIYKNYICN